MACCETCLALTTVYVFLVTVFLPSSSAQSWSTIMNCNKNLSLSPTNGEDGVQWYHHDGSCTEGLYLKVRRRFFDISICRSFLKARKRKEKESGLLLFHFASNGLSSTARQLKSQTKTRLENSRWYLVLVPELKLFFVICESLSFVLLTNMQQPLPLPGVQKQC